MIKINLDKAKEIHKNTVRGARAPKFQELDVQFQRALETGESTTDIVAQKQALRDATKLPDSIESVEELKSHWDEKLLGPNPYSGR
jgi:hypothetical protein